MWRIILEYRKLGALGNGCLGGTSVLIFFAKNTTLPFGSRSLRLLRTNDYCCLLSTPCSTLLKQKDSSEVKEVRRTMEEIVETALMESGNDAISSCTISENELVKADFIHKMFNNQTAPSPIWGLIEFRRGRENVHSCSYE